MKLTTPKTLGDIATAIGELQGASNWFQGQMNLLLAFIVSTPENRNAFIQFTKKISSLKLGPDQAEMQSVAKFFADHLEPQPPQEPSGKAAHESDPLSNVIQFPKFPPED